MAAPVKPSDFEALIVEDTDTLCVALKKTFIQLPILLYRLTKWMFDTGGDSGAFSAAFGAMVCDIECPDLSATPDTGDTSTIPPT